MKIKCLLLSALLPALTALPAFGQDDGFDLSSQRGEKQEYNPVNGHKIDHKGLIINPTPQTVAMSEGSVDVSNGFKVTDRQKSLGDALGFLRQDKKGLPLTIDFGAKAAKKAGVKDVDGAYVLEIGKKGIKITGYNDRGAFYGLQTLRQILSSPIADGGKTLPLMTVNDYPSMKYRGVVEGFYGTPWSHDVRMSLIDFYGKNKMNDYLYGPKDDPYHSSPYWRQPYPEDQARNIKELVEQSKRNRVNFIWAIHPGKDIRWNKEDYDSLVGKFNMMYDLGVRSFAIFFDDIDGEGTNPVRQAELLNALTNDFVKTKGDVTNLIVCPTDYSQLWANPGENGALAVYGRELNPNVEVFWTGAVVCSDLTPETLDFINTRIKRPALYWWNYPVQDYCRHILLQGPVYGLDTSLTSEQVAGIESNPMEHGEASKLALYGVADYAWNTPAYNPLDNWERGLVNRVPGDPDAYRTFAIHSADTENGYRRDESWETTVFPYNKYTHEQFEALRAEYDKITGVEGRLQRSADPALLKELQPWLTQFTALGERGLRTLDLIEVFELDDNGAFWKEFIANRMTPEQIDAYNAHKIGTMKLQPFYQNAMDDMIVAFWQKLTGEKPAMYRGIGNVPYLSRDQIKPMLDGDTTTFYTTAYSQGPDTWFGIDMLQARPVKKVHILQGRNSVDDGDYLDHVILEASVDGKNWIALTEPLKKTYEFEWKGEEPLQARYVRLRRLESDRRSWAAVREFEIVTEGSETANAMTDLNPLTSMLLPGSFKVAVADKKELVVLKADDNKPVVCIQYDNKGKTISRQELTDAFSNVSVDPKATEIELLGDSEVFEIIRK